MSGAGPTARWVASRSPEEPELHYLVGGAGDTLVVLIHGWCCSSAHWASQIDAIGPRWRALAPDLRFHGASGGDAHPIDADGFVRDVERCIEAEDLDAGRARPVVLVGHSMGAYVAALLLDALGPRVCGLVAVESLWEPTTPVSDDELAAAMALWDADPVQRARRFVTSMFPHPASFELRESVLAGVLDRAPGLLGATQRAGIEARNRSVAILRRTKVPLRAINAMDWRNTDLAAAREIGMEVQLLPGVGHFPMLEAPEATSRALVRVLDVLGGR